MTAPVASARVTPVGIKLRDGYQTLVTIAADTDISFWEKTVQPPGLDGGDAIDTTTMFNETLRTFTARSLTTMTEMSITAAYDPAAFDQLQTILNVPTTITVTFPDGSTLAFYGYVRSVEPSENTEGEQPEMTIVIQPTNEDPTTGEEEPYVVVEVPGT